jgi:hypothetical protein
MRTAVTHKKRPAHYRNAGINWWSPSKINAPLWYLIAEYTWRQQLLWQCKKARDAGDAEAEYKIDHLTKAGSIKMEAGTHVAEAAFRVLNGKLSPQEAHRHVISKLQEHQPAAWNEADQTFTAHFLDEADGSVEQTLEQTTAGLREVFAGANQVEVEEKIELELPGIDVPIIGYSDGRGGGTVVELKTRWDQRDKRSSSGFKINSLPKTPRVEDVRQVAVYQRQHGGRAVLLYANRKDYRAFEIPQDDLDEAMTIVQAICRKRQRILERTNGELEQLIDLVECDWSHYRFSDWSPDLRLHLKQVFLND